MTTGEDRNIRRDRLSEFIDAGHRLAVVRAPVGFGKSVFLSHWLSTKEAEGEHVLLVEVEGTGPTSEILWTPIGSALGAHAAGGAQYGMALGSQMHSSPKEGSFAGLADLLGALDQPLTLVIDQFEHLTDTHVLRDFADLVDRCPLVHVVLAGRFFAGVDDLPASLVPTTVILETDLAFTEAETALVLHSVDRSLTEADVAAVHRKLKGWPLAIGELAQNLSPTQRRPDLSHALTAAARRVCKEVAEAVGVDESDLGALATANELNLDTATLLMGNGQDLGGTESGSGHDPAVLLDRLDRNGMFNLPVPSSGESRSSFVWSAVRHILRENFVIHHPDLARRLDGVMADWFATHDAPSSSLTHAARARRWDLVVSLLRDHSIAVLETEWREFSRAIATAPDEVFSDSPAGIAWRTMAFHLPIDPRSTPVPRTLTPAELTAIGRLPRAREELQAQLWQLLLYRTRHMYERAAIASDNAQAIMQEAMVTRGPEVVGLQSIVTMNSGLLQLFLGNFRTAISEFCKSYEFASLSELSFSAADAAGKIALTNAMLGDELSASFWLQREVVSPVPQTPMAPYVRSAGLIARALAASVALRADQCATAIDALKKTDNHEELWPFVAYARKRQALLWGDRQNALDELESFGEPPDQPTDTNSWGGVTTWLFPAARAELLMALGRGNHAKSVLDETRGDHPLLDLARARLALLSGDNEHAVSLLNAMIEWHPGGKPTGAPRSDQIRSLDAPHGWQLSSPLQRMETLIIGGVANFRLGATEVAADMLERAVNQAHRLGSLLPFVRVPREDLSALAAVVPSLEQLLHEEALASTPDIYPANVDLVTLTERETVILEGIAAGRSLRQIAAMNYVSTNTIKTQTQVLYRKLRANSRREALLAASGLQLFEPGRTDEDAPPLAALP